MKSTKTAKFIVLEKIPVYGTNILCDKWICHVNRIPNGIAVCTAIAEVGIVLAKDPLGSGKGPFHLK